MDETQVVLDAEAQIFHETRKAQNMSLRAFGPALGVTYGAAQQWENGVNKINDDRITTWLVDPRPWVKQLAFRLFMARHGDTLIALSHAAQNTESKAA